LRDRRELPAIDRTHSDVEWAHPSAQHSEKHRTRRPLAVAMEVHMWLAMWVVLHGGALVPHAVADVPPDVVLDDDVVEALDVLDLDEEETHDDNVDHDDAEREVDAPAAASTPECARCSEDPTERARVHAAWRRAGLDHDDDDVGARAPSAAWLPRLRLWVGVEGGAHAQGRVELHVRTPDQLAVDDPGEAARGVVTTSPGAFVVWRGALQLTWDGEPPSSPARLALVQSRARDNVTRRVAHAWQQWHASLVPPVQGASLHVRVRHALREREMHARLEKLTGVLDEPVHVDADRIVARVLAGFAHEPDVRAVQAAAVAVARVHPDVIDDWRTRARLHAWAPRISTGASGDRGNDARNIQNLDATASDIRTHSESTSGKLDVTATWEFNRLIFEPAELTIAREGTRLTRLRDRLLDDVTKKYFERRRMQVDLALNAPADLAERAREQLRVAELTADLDALTDGFFTQALAEAQP
jgi:hypothetical protein